MTSREPTKRRGGIRFALVAVFAFAVSGAIYAACGGGANCTCEGFQGKGMGWCPPGPNDCQACTTVLCPGYCFYNLAPEDPIFVGDAGCQ
jgi:hypothetical protein